MRQAHRARQICRGARMRRTLIGLGAVQASSALGANMADKSPRQHMQKKAAGKSIKEKRLDKKAKSNPVTEIIPATKKH